jgi:hypothetical protein
MSPLCDSIVTSDLQLIAHPPFLKAWSAGYDLPVQLLTHSLELLQGEGSQPSVKCQQNQPR